MSFISPTSLASPLIVALAVNWGLQGMLCLLVYTYYIAFPKDRLHPQLQVYGILICEFIQTALVGHDVIVALGTSPGDLNELNAIHTHWFSIPVCGGITGAVGQLFFAYRIWMISSQLAPTIAIAVLSLLSLCAAMVSAWKFFHAGTFQTLLGSDAGFPFITAWNGIGAICDITIVLSMPYFLMRHGTGLPSTHIMIVRLVRLLIETGGLTAIVAILHLCLFSSHNVLFVIPGLAMSKVYAITMLVILNNRLKISGGRFDIEEDEECSLPQAAGRRQTQPKTQIIVTNRRLTFRLANIPSLSDAISENVPDDSSVLDVNMIPPLPLAQPHTRNITQITPED